MLILYGIKNCDTMKKAQRFLTQHALPYRLHDYRVDGLSLNKLQEFATALGWQNLLNTRGTTWRQLPDNEKYDLTEPRALTLMLNQPTLIKRPILSSNGRFLLGFSDTTYCSFTSSLSQEYHD